MNCFAQARSMTMFSFIDLDLWNFVPTGYEFEGEIDDHDGRHDDADGDDVDDSANVLVESAPLSSQQYERTGLHSPAGRRTHNCPISNEAGRRTGETANPLESKIIKS